MMSEGKCQIARKHSAVSTQPTARRDLRHSAREHSQLKSRQRSGHGKRQSEDYFVVHWSPALGSDRERASLLWLGLRPQEIWAEQIPRPYFHPKTRKNRSRVGGPSTRALKKTR